MDKNKPIEVCAEYNGQRIKSNLTLYEYMIVEVARAATRRNRVIFADDIARDTVEIVNTIFQLTETKQ